MGFSIETSVPILTVFLQGLLSFFSPCLLPLLPMYISYLSGGGRHGGPGGQCPLQTGPRIAEHRLFCGGHQLCLFPAGVWLHCSRAVFPGKRMLLGRVGGVLVILFGLYQLGVFGSSKLLNREARLPFRPGQSGHEPSGGSGAGLYLQLCLDPLRRPHLGKRPADGHLCQSSPGLCSLGCTPWGLCCPFWRWPVYLHPFGSVPQI